MKGKILRFVPEEQTISVILVLKRFLKASECYYVTAHESNTPFYQPEKINSMLYLFNKARVQTLVTGSVSKLSELPI